MGAERRLLGVVKEFQSADRVASPAGSRFPSVSLGYHLYADAAGAAEALNAPLPELLLRLSEENDLVEARKLPLREIPPTGAPGEQARALSGHVKLDDGIEVEVLGLRWRRGAVELFAMTAVAPGVDAAALLRRVIELHDWAYVARPLPGF